LAWLQDANEFLMPLLEDPEFGPVAKEVDKAKNTLGEAAFGFQQLGKQDPEYPLLHATPFLRMFGLVESAQLLLKQATIAREKLGEIWEDRGIDSSDREARRELMEANENARFYENKIATMEFFVFQILPEGRAILKSIQSGDRSALDVIL